MREKRKVKKRLLSWKKKIKGKVNIVLIEYNAPIADVQLATHILISCGVNIITIRVGVVVRKKKNYTKEKCGDLTKIGSVHFERKEKELAASKKQKTK